MRRIALTIYLLWFTGMAFSQVTHNVKTDCGAVGDGVANDTSAINTCIAALSNGDTLLFPAGTYLVTGSGLSRISVNNVTVDGSSSTATLKATSGSILQVGAGTSLSSTTPFTANAAELATSFTANASAIGLASGDYIFITQLPSGGSGARGEVLLAQTVSGNTITVATALHQAYTTANSATVQKISTIVTGLNVHDIIIDGGGTATNGLNVDSLANSTFSNITVQNVLGTSGPFGSGGSVTPYLTYNVEFDNLTITGSKGTAFLGFRMGNMVSTAISIHNMLNNGATGSFGFVIAQDANGEWDNISVDATGTGGGRPFKINSSDYGTYANASVNHGEGANYNGITLEFFSAHNTFNDCIISNNLDTTGAHLAHGLYLYGNVDQGASEGNNNFNTFNNCQITNNDGYGVIISDSNTDTTFNGGTITGKVSGNFGVWLNGSCCNNISNFYMHNMHINGPASIGIQPAGTVNGCINNNAFTGISTTISLTGTNTGTVGVGNTPNNGNLPNGTCGFSGPAALSLAPSTLTFASQLVGTSSASQSLTLTNTGGQTATISSIAITGNNSGDYSETDNCSTTLVPGDNCVINVTFTPTASGPRNAFVVVTDTPDGLCVNTSLTGTGVSGSPNISFSPTSLTFASQLLNTTSAAKTVTVTNTGTANLTISAMSLGGNNPGDFFFTTNPSNNCGGTLAPNATCTVSVTFTPTVVGARSASISVTDNAPGSPQAVPLSGTGTQSGIGFNPTSLTFPSTLVGSQTSPLTVTVTSNGTSALTINGITISGANPSDFTQTNNCPISPSTLAINATCTVNVTFKPIAAGSRTATVSFSDNAPANPQAVPIQGIGTQPQAFSQPVIQRGAKITNGATIYIPDYVTSLLLPAGSVSTPYNTVLTANGGNPGFNWIDSGTCPSTINLPPGLSLSCNGTISGTPTVAGSFPFAVTACDSFNFCASANLSIAVTGTQPPPVTGSAELPQLWVNTHVCDAPGGVYDVTKTIKADGTGDYACSMAGLQASMDQWASSGIDQWEHVIIDATTSGRGRCQIIGTTGGPVSGGVWVLKTKVIGGQPANKCIVYESSNPNPSGNTVCVTASDPSQQVRNPGCTSPNDKANMWGLTSTTSCCLSSGDVMQAGPFDAASGWGINHIVIKDVEITPAPTPSATFMIDLDPHDSSGNLIFSQPATNPHNYGDTVGFERIYLHGDFGDNAQSAAGYNVVSAINYSLSNFWLEWSYMDQLAAPNSEGHYVSTSFTPGPIKYVGNFIEGESVNLFFGGKSGITYNLIPANIEIRRNVLTMNPAWIPATFCVQHRKKSNTEFKIGQQILVNGNVYTWSTGCGQDGQLITANIRGSSGGTVANNYLSKIWDMRVTNNLFAHATAGFELDGRSDGPSNGGGQAFGMRRLTVINNLGFDMAPINGRIGKYFPISGGSSGNGFKVASASRSNGIITMVLQNCAAWGCGTGLNATDTMIGDPINITSCTGDTSVNTPNTDNKIGPPALVGTITGGLTIVFDNAGPNNSNLNVTGCIYQTSEGWPADMIYRHNTWIYQSPGKFATSINNAAPFPTFMLRATYQDNLMAVNPNVPPLGGWTIGGGTEGLGSEVTGWDQYTLTADHNTWPGRASVAANYVAFNPTCAAGSAPGTGGNCPTGNQASSHFWFPALVPCPNATVGSSDCIGFKGMMSTGVSGFLLNSTNPFVDYDLVADSPYKAGNARQASDGTNLGVDMNALHNAMTEHKFSGCSLVQANPNYCGSTDGSLGPFPD